MNSLQAQRIELRKGLWSNCHHRVSTLDSFDRVKVLSPSLANCLLQRTTQDREVDLNYDSRKIEEKNAIEALEKLTYYSTEYEEEEKYNERCDYVQAAQPYLRSSVIDKYFVHLFVQHSSQPRLRSIEMYEDDESQVYEYKAFVKFGPQLQSFTYGGTFPFELISSVDAMSRLKKLKISFWHSAGERMVQPNIEYIIPWHKLSSFSFWCGLAVLECAQLLEQLGQMTQLRKLSIELPFPKNIGSTKAEEIKQFLTVKFSKIPKFSKLEVLRFGVNVVKGQDSTLDYRFLVGLLVPKLGATLTKLIFPMPLSFSSTSNCICLDYSNEFPHLETLVLDYRFNDDDTFPKLYEHGDKLTPSQSILNLTIAYFHEEKFSFSEIFQSIPKQIPDIFPNLVELNFKVKDTIEFQFSSKLTDRNVMSMIERLPRLRTLRFMDNFPKFRRLMGSIELMCKRAVELKPKVPMLFRVPIGHAFVLLKYSNVQLPDELKHNFYCWEKAAKWIRIY